jgi:hypothetical protein
MLVFNYTKIYELNFCEIDTREEVIKVDKKFLEKFAINYKKSDVILNSTKAKEENSSSLFSKQLAGKKTSNKSNISQNIKPISYTTKFQNLEYKIEISQNRHSLISIGISTIKRPNSSYLKETLDSLFYSINAEEKKLVLIIVLIAEVRS